MSHRLYFAMTRSVGEQPEIIRWAREMIEHGYIFIQLVRACRSGEDGYPGEPLDDGREAMRVAFHIARARLDCLDKARRTGISEPEIKALDEAIFDGSPVPLVTTWNGKSKTARQRELRDARKAGEYPDQIQLQYQLSKLCRLVEGVEFDDWEMPALGKDMAQSVLEDLITVAESIYRQISAAQNFIGSNKARERIRQLRNTTGRTPEEAATALWLADKLERQLESQLTQ